MSESFETTYYHLLCRREQRLLDEYRNLLPVLERFLKVGTNESSAEGLRREADLVNLIVKTARIRQRFVNDLPAGAIPDASAQEAQIRDKRQKVMEQIGQFRISIRQSMHETAARIAELRIPRTASFSSGGGIPVVLDFHA